MRTFTVITSSQVVIFNKLELLVLLMVSTPIIKIMQIIPNLYLYLLFSFLSLAYPYLQLLLNLYLHLILTLTLTYITLIFTSIVQSDFLGKICPWIFLFNLLIQCLFQLANIKSLPFSQIHSLISIELLPVFLYSNLIQMIPNLK